MEKIIVPLLVFSALVIGGCTFQFNSETSLPTVTPMTTPIITVTPSVDETSVIKVAIKKALVAKHGESANELTVSVSKIAGNYSQGGASASGGGGMWFGVKVNNEWGLVWDGNGSILCQDLTAYPDFPVALISECYDQKTNKTVKR